MTERLVVKLGGSVVTRKDERETVDQERLAAVADALAGTDAELVVVHGGGSFGHPAASRHGVTETAGSSDPAAVRAIHGVMTRLNAHVVDALGAVDVPAVPVQPLSAAARDDGGTLEFPTAAVEGLLAEGFVPVLHGDVVAHGGEGVTVLSGDEIVTATAPAVDADRVGLCSTVPGVLNDRGEVVERIDTYEEVAALLGESDATDVTGGMAGKVRALLDLAAPAQIFGPRDLSDFLAGESPGTTVDGREESS